MPSAQMPCRFAAMSPGRELAIKQIPPELEVERDERRIVAAAGHPHEPLVGGKFGDFGAAEIEPQRERGPMIVQMPRRSSSKGGRLLVVCLAIDLGEGIVAKVGSGGEQQRHGVGAADLDRVARC